MNADTTAELTTDTRGIVNAENATLAELVKDSCVRVLTDHDLTIRQVAQITKDIVALFEWRINGTDA